MRKYDHDTYYYGGEIINAINKAMGCKYAMDRGGTYIWCVLDDTSTILFLDLNGNDCLGSLEWHNDGNYKAGITALSLKNNDGMFDVSRINQFVKEYF